MFLRINWNKIVMNFSKICEYKSSFILFFPDILGNKCDRSAAFQLDNTAVSLADKSLPAPR